MYIARIPLRVSLLGGGSDLPEFYETGEIGEVIGVSESRVSQIHSQAAMRLRARLSDWN
mgnify:CR=1 FL=1